MKYAISLCMRVGASGSERVGVECADTLACPLSEPEENRREFLLDNSKDNKVVRVACTRRNNISFSLDSARGKHIVLRIIIQLIDICNKTL